MQSLMSYGKKKCPIQEMKQHIGIFEPERVSRPIIRVQQESEEGYRAPGGPRETTENICSKCVPISDAPIEP